MGPSYVATTADLGSTWTMTQLPGQDRVISSMVAHGGGNRWYVASRIWENPTTSTTPQGSTQTRYEQAVQILASADNGQSWTVARTIRNYPHFMGNTDVAADGKGNVIVTWAGAEGNQPSTSSQIYAQRSTDHGATWGETMRIAPPGEPK